MVGHTRSYRGGPGIRVLQALVGSSEVVVLEVQGDSGGVVLDLFENPLVSRVNRRIPILMVRLARST